MVANGSCTPEEDFFLERFHPDGSLDLDFGDQGMVSTDWGGAEYPSSVVLQPNGKIVAVGSVTIHGSGFSIVMARYNPDGSLDPTFGYNGQVLTDITYEDYAEAVAVQEDGKIVLAGSVFNDTMTNLAVVRYK